jgi:chromosome segregation ATPase
LEREFYKDVVHINREFVSLSEKIAMLEDSIRTAKHDLSTNKKNNQELTVSVSELENALQIQWDEITSHLTKMSAEMKKIESSKMKGTNSSEASIELPGDVLTMTKFRAFRFAIVRDISEVKEAFANRIQSTQKNLEMQVKISENIRQGVGQLQEQMVSHEQQLSQLQKNNRSMDPSVERKIDKVMKEQKKLSDMIRDKGISAIDEEMNGLNEKIRMLMKALQMMAIRIDVLNPSL